MTRNELVYQLRKMSGGSAGMTLAERNKDTEAASEALQVISALEKRLGDVEPGFWEHKRCLRRPVECGCHPSVRWSVERWGHPCIISELMVALRGLLTIPVVGLTLSEAETIRQLNLPLYEKARAALAAADAMTFVTNTPTPTEER